jgi:hypothetical protein
MRESSILSTGATQKSSYLLIKKFKTMKKEVKISERILWIYYIIVMIFVILTTLIW